MQGLPSGFVARMGEWEFPGVQVHLAPLNTLDTHDHPAALRNALRQLINLYAPGASRTTGSETVQPELHLVNWDWEQEGMVEAVVQCVPELPMLNRFVKVVMRVPLTDARLGAVLAMGAHVHGLSVQKLELQMDAHAYEPWLWRVFECEGHVLNDPQLFRLPHPRSYQGGDGERPVLQLLGRWSLGVNKVRACMRMHHSETAAQQVTHVFLSAKGGMHCMHAHTVRV